MSYLTVICNTLPEAWEQAVLRCWEEGDRIRSEYDKPSDPESRDCTIMIVAQKPFQEPRIHKAFPGSLEDLEIYRQEVVDGIHDHWVNPEEGKWSYTYHQRLFAYDLFGPDGKKRAINQFDYIIEKLASAPHSRRAQAITWKPDVDPGVDDPACLQRIWARILGDELLLNTHMRSNDAFKASFMNMWAFTSLQRFLADRISQRLNRAIRPGAYAHIVDSFHIYGSYFKQFEGFLQSVKKRSFADRTWDSTNDFVQSAFDSARARIAQEQERDRAKR